ncbi:MAG TPA: LysM peptidoglycan-binding domain-containing M23 family metallopeptidase [bacterium]|jgi:murein DD-endopeptidase MepM/ murein hydrolase activator NlpD|nr:LysM peptidoglycan-binding domain-containing M23 family metallopeptidase [bacterium]
MADPSRRIFLSISAFLVLLWLGMLVWAAWLFTPKLIAFMSAPQIATQVPNLESAPGITVPGFQFFIYHTILDDTFDGLAKKFNLSEETLRSLNECNNRNEPKLESTLLIPSKDGIFHVVQPGQGLADIAKAYQVSLMSVLEANHKTSDSDLKPGEILYLPGAQYLSNRDVHWLALIALTTQKTFMKPTTGRFADGFGQRVDPISGKVRFHAGLDLAPGLGARVVAAQDGTVIWAGVRAGFGQLIILDHGNQLTTWYAHLEQILVKPQQIVKKGDLIGKVGSSGRTTGPHLHFEVRLNNKPQNPLLYLVP